MLSLTPPFPQFFDLDGTPLDQGFLYFGAANQNPQASPIPVFWDAAGDQPAAQPLRTLNGYVARAGTPAAVYIDGDFSLEALSKAGVFVLYAPTSANGALQEQLAGVGGSGKVGYQYPADGTERLTLQEKLDALGVHMKDFLGSTAAALTAAATASGPYGIVNLKPKTTYALNSVPSMPNAAIRGVGSNFSGNYPRSVADGSALPVSNDWLAGDMSRTGTGTGGSANQHLMHLSVYSAPTNSAAPYEKTAQYIRFSQADSSDGTSILRDFVGQQITGELGPSVSNGRAWAQHLWIEAPAGTEGYLVGQEIEVYNKTGTAAFEPDQLNTKLGIHLVAGEGISTAGIYFNNKPNGATWHNGIYAHKSALNEGLIRIDNDFIITKDGRIARGTVTPNFETALTYIGVNENAIVRLESPTNKSAYITYAHTGTISYAAGIAANSNEFVITTSETTAGIPIFRGGAAAVGFMGAAPFSSTGWVMPTGSTSKATFDTTTVDVAGLAAYVSAMASALKSYGFLKV